MALRLFTKTSLRSSRIISRTLFTSIYRRAAESSAGKIPTDLEQATGIERKELEAILAGHQDPFNLNVTKSTPGTRAAPTLVPSLFEERIVGCVCEEDATSIKWMVLKKGGAQRCSCGHFFQLVTGKTNALADD